jgi:hypothetical protein
MSAQPVKGQAGIVTDPTAFSGFQYILSYGLVIMLFVMLSKIRAGYVFLYYLLVLCILYVIVVDYQWIAQTIAPVTGTIPATAVLGTPTAGAASS